jgi:hypothetical protein
MVRISTFALVSALIRKDYEVHKATCEATYEAVTTRMK